MFLYQLIAFCFAIASSLFFFAASACSLALASSPALMAAVSVFVMELDQAVYDQQTEPMCSHINVGYGEDITIAELAHAVGITVGYKGKIVLDPSKPDGSPRKWMDSSRLNRLGWQAKCHLEKGLALAYADFQKTQSKSN